MPPIVVSRPLRLLCGERAVCAMEVGRREGIELASLSVLLQCCPCAEFFRDEDFESLSLSLLLFVVLLSVSPEYTLQPPV